MPPTLSVTTPLVPATGALHRAGWLLPAGLLFSLLLLGRWSQLPAGAARTSPATQVSGLRSQFQFKVAAFPASAP